jgi:hypothetical protein
MFNFCKGNRASLTAAFLFGLAFSNALLASSYDTSKQVLLNNISYKKGTDKTDKTELTSKANEGCT